ncbi:DUF6895 family protein [Lentzea sp.]|uniref:DUF6895 family protein n=1 Tax=Lentzea sp. TaxID=56099 RepID=UPI002BA55670|nr:hypothetical protein [Lentzea sp.]HUQ59592.1 hypothetical protein [Lentzea sp.]
MTGTPDVETPTRVRDRLGGLAEGVMRWLGRNMSYFDPFSPSSPLPENRRVKAALELAVFCHRWEKLEPEDDLFHEATSMLQGIFPRPEFVELIDTHGGVHAGSQRIVYVALAPRTNLREAVLARLKADDYLSPQGKSAYVQLETRYYADKAHLEHSLESYQDLTAKSLLASPPVPPVPTGTAYALTHTAFFLGDYGHRDMGLPGDVRERAERAVCSMLDSSAGDDLWDLTSELLITLAGLGGDVLATPSGQAGIRCLARAQQADGAIPGRSAASGVPPSLPPGQFFRRCYHTTLVTALMTLAVR